jgi:hypothetical protein
MVWGELKVEKNSYQRSEKLQKLRKNHGLGGAESEKKLILHMGRLMPISFLVTIIRVNINTRGYLINCLPYLVKVRGTTKKCEEQGDT